MKKYCANAVAHRPTLARSCTLALTAAAWFLAAPATAATSKVTATRGDDRVTIRVGDDLFTEYLVRSGNKPVLWPVIGPTGKPMTRSYPVGPRQPGESNDHIHHRSMWFAYEGFNWVDFWHEPELDGGERHVGPGQEKHRAFVTVSNEDDGTALVVTQTDYVDADGKKICEDERTMRFGADEDQRWIDYQIKLIASEGPLEIGDSKEGVFAIRVPTTMKVDARQGGEIVSSRGLKNDEAWGQPAEWVDYHGPVEGETLGIAMLTHPDSYNATPRWHVRTYGLFAANPFGELAYATTSMAPVDIRTRPVIATIPQGDSITLRYRVIFHRGDEKQAKIAEAFAKYAAED